MVEQPNFEVQVRIGSRWTVQNLTPDKWAAQREAKALLASGQFDAVQVLEQRIRRNGRIAEKVVFEAEGEGRPEPPVNVVPVDWAPVCETLDDFYAFPSRKTIGRLLRKYLDKHVITPTELLHNITHLRLVQRQESLIGQAVARVATLQSEKTGQNPSERNSRLYWAVDRMVARAQDCNAVRRFVPDLREKRMPAFYQVLAPQVPAHELPFVLRATVAACLSGGSSWVGKLDSLFELVPPGPAFDRDSAVLVDEILAEILDGANGVQEMLGARGNLGRALIALVDLSAGRATNASGGTDLTRLNKIMAANPMPCTREVLFERVARELGSTKPLTRDQGEDDSGLFATFMEATVAAGPGYGRLAGGTPLAEAVTKRGVLMAQRMVQSGAIPQGLEQVLREIPSRVGQLQYLVDLMEAPYGQDILPDVIGAIRHVLDVTRSAAELLPDSDKPLDVLKASGAMQRAFLRAKLPDQWRQRFVERVDMLVCRYVQQERVIATLDPRDQPLNLRTRRLLEICARGILQEGQALEILRDRIRDRLRSPNFVEHYVEGVPAEGREQAVRDLHALVQRAGLRGGEMAAAGR